MAESAIRDYAKTRGFHRRTLDRWLGWQPADQDALEEIAVSLKVSENHLRDMMDWLEEISLRDDVKYLCNIETSGDILDQDRPAPRPGR